MAFSFLFEFIRVFAKALLYCLPILLVLVACIIGIGLLIGRREKWSRSVAVYYAFITATTVGYGDFHPKHRKSRYLAIAIAFLGLLLTGIIVAVGVQATSAAFEKTYYEQKKAGKQDSPIEQPG